jgi:hypothetical protein
MVNFELIKAILPAWVVVPFMFMLISGLLSTVDSNLCAVASLTTDLKVSLKTGVSGKSALSIGSMVLLLIVSILIANIPGLTVTHMFLIYCTFRAATMLPTIFTLLNMRLTGKGIVAGIITALTVGMPTFAYGTIYGLSEYKTAGSLLTVLLSGLVAVVISRRGTGRVRC